MRATIVVGLLLFGSCGGSSSARTDATGDPPIVDLDTRVRVCAILGACLGTTMNECLSLVDPEPAQVACVLDAGAASCTAVLACFGVRITNDPSCMPGCADGDTVVRCSAPQRIETDCGDIALENVGPACVVGDRIDCGGAACPVEDEYSCNGAISTFCDSGVTEVFDCSERGLECVAREPRCVGIASGTCAAGTAAACEGSVLVTCDAGTTRRQDCMQSGGRGCFAGKCAYGDACIPVPSTDTCNGTTLEVCAGGVVTSIDCTTVGATSCTNGRCR